MKTINIKDDTRIPGTNITLESGDLVYFKESARAKELLDQAISFYRDKVFPQLEEDEKILDELLDLVPGREAKAKWGDIIIGSGPLSITFKPYFEGMMTTTISGKDNRIWMRPFNATPENYAYGLDGIRKYLKEINYSSFKNKIPQILRDFCYNDTFLRKIQRLFGKYSAEGVIGGWIELCLKAGTAKKFANIINASYSGEAWAKEIERIADPSKDAVWALEHQEKIYKSLCDPIETVIFGSPVSSTYEG